MLFLILNVLAKLPLPFLRIIGTAMGTIAYYFSPRLRAVVTENVAQADLNLDAKTIIQNIARGAMDMIWVWFNSQATVVSKIAVIDSNALAKSLSSEHPSIVITPHLGCFEALGKWYASIHPMTAMYRRPDKPWIAQLVERARHTPNLHMAPADTKGVRMALRTLKQNGTVCILPDQVPKQGEGIWLPWFGRDAYTITLPAKLYTSTQANMYIICALPNQKGWDMVCNPIEIPEGLSTEALTLHLNQVLEQMVMRAPAEYAWSYKRYKRVLGMKP